MLNKNNLKQNVCAKRKKSIFTDDGTPCRIRTYDLLLSLPLYITIAKQSFGILLLANLTVELHYRTTISIQIVALYKLPILDCLLWSGLSLYHIEILARYLTFISCI